MHFQKKPFSQKKILRVIEGKIFDVVLDIRKKSKTFGQYRTFILSEQNKKQIFIGEGFAHGYMTLSKTAKVEYLCSNFYRSDYESCIKWDDPDINIKWPKDKKFLISPKDEKGIFFSEI